MAAALACSMAAMFFKNGRVATLLEGRFSSEAVSTKPEHLLEDDKHLFPGDMGLPHRHHIQLSASVTVAGG